LVTVSPGQYGVQVKALQLKPGTVGKLPICKGSSLPMPGRENFFPATDPVKSQPAESPR
jgi:hypothetical protein